MSTFVSYFLYQIQIQQKLNKSVILIQANYSNPIHQFKIKLMSIVQESWFFI